MHYFYQKDNIGKLHCAHWAESGTHLFMVACLIKLDLACFVEPHRAGSGMPHRRGFNELDLACFIKLDLACFIEHHRAGSWPWAWCMWQRNNNKTPVKWHMMSHEPLKKKEEERDQVVKDDLVTTVPPPSPSLGRTPSSSSLVWVLHVGWC